jgi:hypothetical protein
MDIWIIATLAYCVVGYLTALVVAWIEGEDTGGFWFSIAAFWPLVWVVGIGFVAIWLFETPPNWIASKRRGRRKV